MSGCTQHDMLDQHAAGCSACLAASHAELLDALERAHVALLVTRPGYRSTRLAGVVRVVVARAEAFGAGERGSE